MAIQPGSRAYPQAPLPVFKKCAEIVICCRNSDVDRLQLQPAVASLQLVKPGFCSTPDRAGAVLQEHADPLQSLFGIGTEDDESLRGACSRIKPAQTSAGCHPQNSVAALQQVIDGAVWQALLPALTDELVPIEPPQPIPLPKPHDS